MLPTKLSKLRRCIAQLDDVDPSREHMSIDLLPNRVGITFRGPLARRLYEVWEKSPSWSKLAVTLNSSETAEGKQEA